MIGAGRWYPRFTLDQAGNEGFGLCADTGEIRQKMPLKPYLGGQRRDLYPHVAVGHPVGAFLWQVMNEVMRSPCREM